MGSICLIWLPDHKALEKKKRSSTFTACFSQENATTKTPLNPLHILPPSQSQNHFQVFLFLSFRHFHKHIKDNFSLHWHSQWRDHNNVTEVFDRDIGVLGCLKSGIHYCKYQSIQIYLKLWSC